MSLRVDGRKTGGGGLTVSKPGGGGGSPPTLLPVYRLNVGGDKIVASPNWEEDAGQYTQGTTWSTNTWETGPTPVGGAPAELFLQEELAGPTAGDEIRRVFRVAASDVLIRLFAAATGATPDVGAVFDVRVKVGAGADQAVSTGRDVFAEVGAGTGWLFEHSLTTVDPVTTVEVAVRRAASATRSPKLHGVEILSSVPRPAPLPPTGLTATAEDSKAHLSWAPTAGAVTYNAGRRLTSVGGAYTVDGSALLDLQHTYTGLVNGTGYDLATRAVNETGVSDWSTPVAVTPQASTPPPGAVSTLFVTDALLAAWRDRANGIVVGGGTYVAKGDVSSGSPGDWNRIVADKNGFMADPAGHLWPGPGPSGWMPSTGCVTDVGGVAGPHKTTSAMIASAMLFALVKSNATVATQVATTLAQQVNYQDTVFADSARWCTSNEVIGDGGIMFRIGDWLASLEMAYDLLLAYEQSTATTLWTAAQKTDWKAWGVAWANWWSHHNNVKLSAMFVNRAAGNYTLTSSAKATDSGIGILYDGYLTPWRVSVRYNNRNYRAGMAAGLAYVHAGDTAGIASIKKFVQEGLMFGFFPTGAWSDFERGEPTDASKGFKYAAEPVGIMVVIAEVLRRQGDDSLWTYATTGGSDQTSGDHWTGGPKTLAKLVRDMFRYVDKTFVRRNGGVLIRPSLEWVHDLGLVFGNRFMLDSAVTAAYKRTSAGADPYPDPPNEGQFVPWRAPCGLFPGTSYMLNGLEAVV